MKGSQRSSAPPAKGWKTDVATTPIAAPSDIAVRIAEADSQGFGFLSECFELFVEEATPRALGRGRPGITYCAIIDSTYSTRVFNVGEGLPTVDYGLMREDADTFFESETRVGEDDPWERPRSRYGPVRETG